jgi:hypothetical protein
VDPAAADALVLAACEPVLRRVHRAWRDRAARHADDGAPAIHRRATADALAVAAVLELQDRLRPMATAACAAPGPAAGELALLLPQLPRYLERRAAILLAAGDELLERLAAGAPALRAVRPDGLGPVVGIDAAGDSHAGGRRTVLLRDEEGRGVALKPRSLAPDLAVDAVLAELTPAVPALAAARLPRTVDLGDHGWQRLVDAGGTPPDVEPALLETAGALLAVLHVLRAGDLHAENVVVAGAALVPIDLECVLQPTLGAADANRCRTVAEVGLLPGRDPVHGRDLSPIGAWLAGRPMPRERVRGVLAPALQRGFDAAWDALEALAEDDARVAALEARFAAADVRVVARPTLAYAGLLAEVVSAGALGAADERPLRERLAPSARRPDLVPLVPFEAADLVDGDVPRFVARPGDVGLRHRRGTADAVLRAGAVPTLSGALAARGRPPAGELGATLLSPSLDDDPGAHVPGDVAHPIPTP